MVKISPERCNVEEWYADFKKSNTNERAAFIDE